MTTIEIQLPDQLAHEATHAVLLSPEAIETILRDRLREQRVGELFEAMERMDSVEEPAFMSPEMIAGEIAAMRAERRG